VDDRALGDLRALADRDRTLEEQADRLHARDAEATSLGARAGAIASFFRTYTEEEARRRNETRAARDELAGRQAELATAESDVERATDDLARTHAEHAVERARDHIGVAEARLARATAAEAELEEQAAIAQNELTSLDARAREIEGVPPPEGDLEEWASRAHAELFVAAGQVDAQRERVIREANELASMLLGEATFGSTAAQALARVEHRFVARGGGYI